MSIICPTVTAKSQPEYEEQLARVVPLARRIHFDFMDGIFAPSQSPRIEEAWWPAGVVADLHIMYKRPFDHLAAILKLRPHLVIIHAEAEGNFYSFAEALRAHHIKLGMALLPQTPVSKIELILDQIDHVLIFSGNLGHFGGSANLSLLEKVSSLKLKRSSLEIGWDGGINDHNALALMNGHIDVLNVGGYIQRSPNPTHAYAKLKALA